MSVAPATASPPTAAAPQRGRFPALSRFMDLVRQTEVDLRLFGMVIALAAILVGVELADGKNFLQPINLINLAVQAAPVAIIATGMVLVIVTRQIDLSVGSVVGVVSMTIAIMFFRVFPPTLGVDSTFGWLIALAVGRRRRRPHRRVPRLPDRLRRDPVVHRHARRPSRMARRGLHHRAAGRRSPRTTSSSSSCSRAVRWAPSAGSRAGSSPRSRSQPSWWG